MNKKAVVLLSGGLDSTTCLALAKAQGYQCYALSFNYGQRHATELNAAKRVAEHLGVVEHRIVNLDIGQFKGSALTDTSLEVPEHDAQLQEIPVTYVPARNTVFLAIALGYAEVVGAFDLFIGISSVDYSGYPDCRPEFIKAFQTMADLATKVGAEGQHFTIHTPLQHLSKAETILLGMKYGVDYGLTISCYQSTESGEACGYCDSCTYRKNGFQAAKMTDPTIYNSLKLI